MGRREHTDEEEAAYESLEKIVHTNDYRSAAYVVACWSACGGMPNPVEDMAELKKSKAEWRSDFRDVADRLTEAKAENARLRAGPQWCDVTPVEEVAELKAENARLREALDDLVRNAEIEDCACCGGSGQDPDDKESACYPCGGVGEIPIFRAHPDDIRAGQAALKGAPK